MLLQIQLVQEPEHQLIHGIIHHQDLQVLQRVLLLQRLLIPPQYLPKLEIMSSMYRLVMMDQNVSQQIVQYIRLLLQTFQRLQHNLYQFKRFVKELFPNHFQQLLIVLVEQELLLVTNGIQTQLTVQQVVRQFREQMHLPILQLLHHQV